MASGMMVSENELLEYLVEHRRLMPKLVPKIKSYVERWAVSVPRALLECHILSEEDLAKILSDYCCRPRFKTKQIADYSFRSVSNVYLEFAIRNEILPLERKGQSGYLYVIADPFRRDIAEILASDFERCFFARGTWIKRTLTEIFPVETFFVGL